MMLVMSLRWDYDNVIEMIWYWCWKWHWDEIMLTLIMTLRWDVIDVENIIMIMYIVYVHGGYNDHDGYP